MIVAAHQPAYLPWLGYLDKLAKADLLVVMDELQYEAQNFQNRNRVKLDRGPHWLTVPLLRGAQSDRVMDKRIDNTGRGGRHHWQRRTWRTLEVHYGRSPHFARNAPVLEDTFLRRWDWLVELDLHILELARLWFWITRPIVRASSLGLSGAKTARLRSLCEAVGAHIYLSGLGGSTGYLDTDALARAGSPRMASSTSSTLRAFLSPMRGSRRGDPTLKRRRRTASRRSLCPWVRERCRLKVKTADSQDEVIPYG